MEKTYKRVPFDIELAKKIQSGEIEGEIKTIHSHKARIICWDRKDSETKIVLLVQYGDWEGLHECNTKGEYMEGSGDDAMLNYLILEVPDNEPQFKPFDKVLVRKPDKHELCVSDGTWIAGILQYKSPNSNLYFVSGKGYYDCIPYEGNEHLVGTTKNIE